MPGKRPRSAKTVGAKTVGTKTVGTKAAGTKTATTKSASPRPVAERVRLETRIRKLTAKLAEAKRRIAELEAWAETDPLLDIFNRRGFERELTRAIAYIRRYRASGAVIALDVDRLKPINDTFGHAAGDAVLKAIVHVVLSHVRSSDMVGRLGGDEFAVLLWNLTEADAKAKAAALEDAIDRLTFVFRGHSMSSGASTGVTVLTPSDDAQGALERADQAMYARKAERRRMRS
ncbi:GGDEF domain-containing protein [Bradyrhizobium sp. 2TAF24]|uniref:GGDEF domain-containing protein n=1 Tax=Bradyrhizobium sp. 2TAF24 TaxID=3233011 RepID=UPI003F902C7E